MAIIHISEAEAARDFASLMARVRAGEEVRIDNDSESFMIVPVPKTPREPLMSEVLAGLREDDAAPRPRTLSEAIRLSEARGSIVTLDDQFGNDVEEVIRGHERERLGDRWESF